MTESPRSRRPRRPSFAPVFWGSLALFAVLFTLLTFQLSAASTAPGPRHVLVRKVIKRRVVTTVVPSSEEEAPEEEALSSGPVVSSAPAESVPIEVAPITTGAS